MQTPPRPAGLTAARVEAGPPRHVRRSEDTLAADVYGVRVEAKASCFPGAPGVEDYVYRLEAGGPPYFAGDVAAAVRERHRCASGDDGVIELLATPKPLAIVTGVLAGPRGRPGALCFRLALTGERRVAEPNATGDGRADGAWPPGWPLAASGGGADGAGPITLAKFAGTHAFVFIAEGSTSGPLGRDTPLLWEPSGGRPVPDAAAGSPAGPAVRNSL